MRSKSSREVLLIKQKYGISDDDPVFALLDSYGSLQKNLYYAIETIIEIQKTANTNLQEEKKSCEIIKDLAREGQIYIAEEGLKVKNILTQEMQKKLNELFTQIDNYRSYLNAEKKSYESNKNNSYSSLQTLMKKHDNEREKQEKRNTIFFALIALLVIVQGISIAILLNKSF